jgi:diaminohydroxyphosphoribosylaminopyrimidine deaminase/5-amino-6-(5-phosphoribosylamino)uracil reductase
VLAAGVARVVVAHRDPFPRVDGGGLARLSEAGLAVALGPGAAEARRLNAPYLKRVTTARPFVTAKWAMTLDGKIATSTGQSAWISGERSRALVHGVRGRMDAVAVGIETALADDPLLTARPPGPRTPARLVLDSAARLPLSGRLVASAREVPVWVAVTGRAAESRLAALEAAGCELLRLPGEDEVPVAGLLDALGRRGLTNLLVEGGGRVLGAFHDAGEIDAVDVFVAPILEGGSHPFGPLRGTGVARMADARRLEHATVSRSGHDVRIQGLVARAWWAAAGLDSA